MPRTRPRIAVIGSGIAGLGAARALSRSADVEIFEAGPRPGGHVHTVKTPRGASVDMGFIVFCRATYPHFSRMLEELGVPSRPTRMSFSVRSDSFEFGSASLGAAFARRRDLLRPAHHRFVLGAVGFVRQAARDLGDPAVAQLTVDEYLALRRVPRQVRDRFVRPLMSALWSMAPERAGAFPAATLLRFLHQHGMLQVVFPPRWHTVIGGSARYVEALLAGAPWKLHLGAEVVAVRRHGDSVELRVAGGSRRFDRCVIATGAGRALSLLEAPTDAERRALSAIRYSRNHTWLHGDESFLPRRRAARASWNYDAAGPGDRATVTYDMNRLQGIPGPARYLVTLNPRRPIPDRAVLAHAVFEHPLFDFGALAARRELIRIQGVRRTYYCGAYLGYGFHEDGLRSGLATAARALADHARDRASEAGA